MEVTVTGSRLLRVKLKVTGRFRVNASFPNSLDLLRTQSFCLTRSSSVSKSFNHRGDVICGRWIPFDFHYLNSPPLERGPSPPLIIDILLLILLPVAGFDVSRVLFSAHRSQSR